MYRVPSRTLQRPQPCAPGSVERVFRRKRNPYRPIEGRGAVGGEGGLEDAKRVSTVGGEWPPLLHRLIRGPPRVSSRSLASPRPPHSPPYPRPACPSGSPPNHRSRPDESPRNPLVSRPPTRLRTQAALRKQHSRKGARPRHPRYSFRRHTGGFAEQGYLKPRCAARAERKGFDAHQLGT